MSRLVRPVYLPTVTTGIANSMLIPVLPLYLRDIGLSFSVISAVLGAAGLGAMLGGLPAGAVIARLTERQVQSLAIVTMAVAAAALGWTAATLALVAFRLMFGLALVSFRLALQSNVTGSVASQLRGRVMASLGGSNRLAFFVGPVLGGLVLELTSFDTTFALCGVILVLGVAGSAGRAGFDEPDAAARALRPGMILSMRLHGRRLLRVGAGCALVVTAREGRYVVLPLIADDLGVSPSTVGVLVGVGTGAELVLFPVSGYLMDRYGRLFAMVPAFLLLAVGLVMLAVADSASTVGAASIVAGLGNGLSAGTLRTLSSDLAPLNSRAPFLAGMIAFQDLGRVLGPLVVGLTAHAVGLGGAAAVLAAVLVMGLAHIVFVVGETRDISSKPTR